MSKTTAKVITVTSGKGGVGKSTTSVNIGALLAKMGKKTLIIDFDVGLRKIDALMGLDRRVVYDFVHVMRKTAKLRQAMIADKEIENLWILPTSNTEDKKVLTDENVEELINEIKNEELGFDYIICDSPAGIESGAEHAMHHADIAVVVVNPEIQSIVDADRMIGIIDSKTKKGAAVEKCILVTKYNKNLVKRESMADYKRIEEHLSLPIKGIIMSSEDKIIDSSNRGRPLVFIEPNSVISKGYENFVKRLLGIETISIEDEERGKQGFFKSLLGG